MQAGRPKNDGEDLSVISDRMESIMSKYQHIEIPHTTNEVSSSLGALDLLKLSKERLSKEDGIYLRMNQEDNIAKEEIDEDRKVSISSSDDIRPDRETDSKVSKITSKEKSHNSTLDSKLTISSSHSSESNPSKNQSEKEELWALLNYSKVRLATGATPSTSEAIALGMKNDDVSKMTQEDKNIITCDNGNGNGNHMIDNDQIDDGSSESSNAKQFDEEKYKEVEEDDNDCNCYDEDDNDYDEDDDDEEDDYDDGLPKFTKEQIEEARARAMAALSRSEKPKSTHPTPTTNASNVSKTARLSVSSANTRSSHQSDSFLMKSMALAEEAANAGETEFKTFNKMSILASMKTPRKNRYTSNDRTEFSKVNEERFHRLGVNMRHFITNTKQKFMEAKQSISKIDKKSNGKNVISGVSPLKTFKENCLKVEKMNEEKYGEPWEKSR
jgi:hypothetical protein